MLRTMLLVATMAGAWSPAHAQDDATPAADASATPADAATQAPSTSTGDATAEVPPSRTAVQTAPYDGPAGKSRVERRRDKCRALGEQQQLSGDALVQHMHVCVKR